MNRPTRLIAVLAGIFLLSCSSIMKTTSSSKEFVMTGDPRDPSAQGTTKVSTTDDGNTQVNVEVKHLASPAKIDPDATTFVVWVKDNYNDSDPQNLGALKIDSDLNGKLEAVTPLKSFDLYVTAEPSPTATEPSNDPVLKTSIEVPPSK